MNSCQPTLSVGRDHNYNFTSWTGEVVGGAVEILFNKK